MIKKYFAEIICPGSQESVYLCEDVEPLVEFFKVSLKMTELLKVLTFEDNVSEEYQEYVECSENHHKLLKELRDKI